MKFFPLWWIDTPAGRCACPDGVDCTSPGKHPLTWDGFLSATDDEAQLDAWQERWPLCNWAIATGTASGVVVVDLDVKPGKDGVAAWGALQTDHGQAAQTRTVQTGSGGLHLYFRHPGGTVGNTQNKPARGIDVRGDGGYVVVPPSNHLSGGEYTLTLDAPIADLPAWFLPSLSVQNAGTRAPLQADRGYFPPASAKVLEAAHDALEAHGPAVQGEGGDAHTFRACAILTHDFALTDDEAWPVIEAWNSTCVPPWAERDLRAKLYGGGKYGSAAYGCRRTMDVREQATKILTDWREGGTADPVALVHSVSPVVERAPDRITYTVIVDLVKEATGLSEKQLGLPKAVGRQLEAPKAGEIEITTRPHAVANACLAVIADKVFARNGVLCEVVKAERVFISELEPARIYDLMSESAAFVRKDAEGLVTSSPPEKVAQILHSRRTLPGVRVLEAVTSAPVFLADGSILQERGYNAAARLWLEPDVKVDVLAAPDHAAAVAAVAVFRDLLCDVRFASDGDFSSWLAALLSPLVKAATSNAPAPLVCVSAASPGAGKTLLTDTIARVVTGGKAEVRPYNPKDAGEWGKRLTAFVKAASPVSVFDNCNGRVGDEGLDRLITASTWSDRILGASDAPPLPVVTTWLATGNNIEPHGDTVRRVLIVRVEVDTEKPQERTGFRYDLEGDYALEHRAELLSAALTILRAYHCAGRPAQALPSWGSFTTWSKLVRGALVWAGCVDPFETQRRASAELTEPDNDAHDFWLTVVAASDGSAGRIAEVANSRDVQTVLSLREAMSAHNLRVFLNRFVDKPRLGKRIRRGRGDEGQSVYRVETLSSA